MLRQSLDIMSLYRLLSHYIKCQVALVLGIMILRNYAISNSNNLSCLVGEHDIFTKR